MVSGNAWSVRIVRMVVAIAAVSALATNYVHASNEAPGFQPSNFFSYFTNLSNIAAALVLIVSATVVPKSHSWDVLRGAVTLYMSVTGIIFAVLLSGVSLGVTDPWINTVLHRVVPVMMVMDWVLVRRNRPPIANRTALTWLVVPLAYLAYSLIRGPLVGGFYPYPFIDPTRPGGYGRVALTSVVLALLMALLALVLAAAARPADRSARLDSRPPPDPGPVDEGPHAPSKGVGGGR